MIISNFAECGQPDGILHSIVQEEVLYMLDGLLLGDPNTLRLEAILPLIEIDLEEEFEFVL
jgi:hypothetical protein